MTTAAPRRIRLSGAFIGLTAGMIVVLIVLFYGFVEASRRSILDTADQLRVAAAQRVDTEIARDLGVARAALQAIQAQAESGIFDLTKTGSVERALFAALVDAPTLSEASFTHGSAVKYDKDGDIRIAPEGRWDVTAYRPATGGPPGIWTRLGTGSESGWTFELHEREPAAPFLGGTKRDEDGLMPDPTGVPTFTVAASKGEAGKLVWSDLHWSDLGGHDRVVLTVQKALADSSGGFAGVLRVGVSSEQIDRATRNRVNDADPNDRHRVFLCDPQGRLVSRLDPLDGLALSGSDLRVVPRHAPAEVLSALTLPILTRAAADHAPVSGDLSVGGERYLVTFRALAETQDWIVGIVVPERYYTARLHAVRFQLLAVFALVAAVALGGGAFVTRAVRRALARVEATTTRMRSFDFAPAPVRSPFADVFEVLDSLERAKTAMRALGKYAPLDLVRELVATNVEPKLGGQPADVTVMFSDIEGFTSLAERVTPNELAELLGAYLEAMTSAIRKTGGNIDKFIGDAVMALWNVPSPAPDHPTRACRAVLDCQEATRKLYGSPRWRGLPPLVTRFGVHTDRVLAGHFGAPERMSYTVLGDGVNLAARLEALGKQYGVTSLVSEPVARAAHDACTVRRLDKVAVKGKSVAVVVYELLGPAELERSEAVVAYEAALDDYFARRFDAAINRLAPHADADAPAKVLLERCRRLRTSPPPDTWDGIYVATSK